MNKIFLVLFLFLSASSVFSQDIAPDKLKNDLKKLADGQMEHLQKFIICIGSGETSQEIRHYCIDAIMLMFSNKAIIEVSSLNSSIIKKENPREYFYRIGNLKSIYTEGVEISFQPNHYRTIERISENRYKVRAQYNQIFHGKSKNSEYKDFTIKEVLFNVSRNTENIRNADWLYKIDQITIDTTRSE